MMASSPSWRGWTRQPLSFFRTAGSSARTGVGRGGEALQGLLLLRQPPGQRLPDLRNLLLRKFVEGVFGAARAVEHPDNVTCAAPHAGSGDADAVAADVPGAGVVRHRQHGGVGIRLPQGGDQLFQAGLHLVNDFEHSRTSFFKSP